MIQPTEKFLLEYIRSNSNEIADILEIFLKAKGKIEWLLIANAVPYVYLKAKNFHKDFKIPKKTLSKLEKIYLGLIVRNELFKHEIKNLANEFKKAKLGLIFLKGAAIFTTVYGDEDLRIMGDIDVLIRRESLWQAEEILKKMGYQPKETKEEREIFLTEHFHLSYLKKHIIVELHWDIGEKWHWDIVDSKKTYIEMLFNSAREVNIDTTKISVLSPAHSIFFACFHFERDLFLQHYKIISTPRIYFAKYKRENRLLIHQSFRFLYEIKKMLGYYGNKMNWDDLFYLAKATEKEYEIFTLLFLSEKVAISGVPDFVIQRLKKNLFVRVYILLSNWIPYDSLDHLYVLNRVIYRFMLMYSYISSRKFYLLGMRVLGGRI